MAGLTHMPSGPPCPLRLPQQPPRSSALRAASSRQLRCQAEKEPAEASGAPESPAQEDPLQRQRVVRQAESSDWITTQLTRRFGIAGGLAWLGFLTFGVVSEQIKTRIEVASEENNTKDVSDAAVVETAEGLRFQDLKVGGGASPQRGYLVLLDFKAAVVAPDAGPGPLSQDAAVFEDTHVSGRPVVFVYGAPPPASVGLCRGVELALASMKAGGRRRVIVPPALGFGDSGGAGRQGSVPGGSTLEYDLELIRISIPPS